MQGPGKTFDTSVDWEEIDRRLSEDSVALMAELGGSKKKKDDGGLAFPMASDVIGHYGGMTLRDYFAAKCIPMAWDAFTNGIITFEGEDIGTNEAVAACAYRFADAMLAERAKDSEPNIDYSLKRGDFVRKGSWAHSALEIIDINWALKSAAVKLGADGDIVVWSIEGMVKERAK